jgi:hypothetical protein
LLLLLLLKCSSFCSVRVIVAIVYRCSSWRIQVFQDVYTMSPGK